MEGDVGRDLGCQKIMDGKVNEENCQAEIPSCCLKARSFAPDPELEANCHATVVSGWFSEHRSSYGHCLYTLLCVHFVVTFLVNVIILYEENLKRLRSLSVFAQSCSVSAFDY